PQTERPVDAHHPPDLDARRLLAGLAVPALALALAACGDDDESSASSEPFCDAARELEERFSNIDPSTPEEFEEAIAAINELDPPAEIADDWETMMNAFESLTDIDLTDPNAFDESAFSDAEAASERVGEYMEEECGITG